MSVPSFSELPLRKGDPPYSAWGLYGDDDQLGTVNRLTDKVVAEAAKEIKSGARFSVDLPLDAQNDLVFFDRQPFEKTVYQKKPRIVNDDTWTFNTQSSSQWDGLRHFGYQEPAKFYNGVTLEDIHGDKNSTVNGIQAWAKKGIVGRGILIDYHTWAAKNNPSFDPFSGESIPLAHLKAVLDSQGTQIKFGDILLLRIGYTVAHKSKSRDELKVYMAVKPHVFSGVEQSVEMLEFIWSNFSAVAGDHPAFERYPSVKDFMLHHILLAGWGCPIGELFDLEALADHCQKEKRWSFFFSSEPCHVPGGVASPPNALAIF